MAEFCHYCKPVCILITQFLSFFPYYGIESHSPEYRRGKNREHKRPCGGSPLEHQDTSVLSLSCRLRPLNNHCVEITFVQQVMTMASLYSVAVVLLPRRMVIFMGSVEKHMM